MGRIGRAGDHAEAFLQMPADDDLGRGLAVLLGNGVDDRVAENLTVAVTATEWEPAFNLDIVLGCHFLPMLALGVRMALDLEHLGLDFRGDYDGLEKFVIEIEVADADGADLTHFKSFLKFLPGTVVVAQRLVQVNKVKVFEPKACKHLVQLLERYALTVLVEPKFGGNPNLLAGNAAVFDGLPNAALVLISVRSINVPISGFEGSENAVVSSLACRDGIDAESELGNDDAVVEGDGCLVHGSVVF